MAKIKPTFSFCINCFNYENYIKECINSVLQLKLKQPFEIIVVDDKSTDLSRAKINSFKNKNVFKYFLKKNIGPAKAWEFGIKKAKGKIICRIDGDDKYKKKFKTKILFPILHNKRIDLIYGQTDVINENGFKQEKIASWCRKTKSEFDKKCFERFLLQNDMPTCSMAAKKNIWLQAVPIKTSWAICDWPCNLRMVKEKNVFFQKSIVSSYRLHKNNFSKKVDIWRLACTINDVLQEHCAFINKKLGFSYLLKVYLLGLKNLLDMYVACKKRQIIQYLHKSFKSVLPI